MNDPSSEPDLLDRLAHEFAERCRRGERPALSEYADRHPDLAAEIRELFPALAAMEALGTSGGSGPAVLVGEPPSRLGEYRILREVGRGGMGVVYEAVQESLGRHVALKVLPERAGVRGNALERFKREARAAANLHHTNIVPVFGVGETDGVHYYAMQFISGQGLDAVLDELRRLRDKTSGAAANPRTATLAADLASGHFPAPAADPMAATRGDSAQAGSTVLSGSSHLAGRPDAAYFRTVARLGAQVADALAYAHTQGIVHRDVKPSNLLLDAHGILWVTDFGLAKVEGTDELTNPGDVVGTVRYMAPERFAGKADARSDVYGLGLVLYELLTLRPAFDDSDRLRLIDRIRTEDPPRPQTLDPRIPRDLDLIVRKATARQPDERYATAADLAADLGRFLRDEPVLARRPTLLLRARKWARRNRAVVTAGVIGLVVALTALTGSIGWAVRDRKAREQDRAQEAARKLAVAEHGVGEALEQGAEVRADLRAVLQRPGGVQELLNQPARWEIYLKAARAELGRAQVIVHGASGSLGSEWIARIQQLDHEIASDEADYHLAMRLEQIRVDRATWVGREFDYATALREYTRAFATAGLKVEPGHEQEVAARIAWSAIKEQLLAALDDWAYCAHSRREMAMFESILSTAQLADTEPWRVKVHDPALWKDDSAFLELAKEWRSDPERFRRLPPQMLNLIGLLLTGKQQSESWLRAAQALHPADFWINFELAFVLSTSKAKSQEGIGFYRASLAIRPDAGIVYVNIGNALREHGDFAGAIESYKRSLAVLHDNALAWIGIGTVFSDQGDLPGAIDAYKKALALDPKRAQAWYNLGNALDRQLDRRGAVDAYHNALAVDPNFVEAWANLGAALRDQRNVPAAIDAFEKALAIDSKHVRAWNGLGVALHDSGRDAAAIEAFEKALAIDPKHSEAWYNKGLALFGQKDLPAAIDAYRKALKIDPRYVNCWRNLGIALYRQKDLPEAIVAFKKVIELDRKLPDAHYALGELLKAQSKFPEAIAEYGEAIELNPDYADAHNSIARLLANCPDPTVRDAARALEHAKKAVAIRATDARSLGSLGMAHYRCEHWQEAVTALKTADELLKSRAVDTQFVLAMAYWKLGKKDDGRSVFNDAVRRIGQQPASDDLRRFRMEAEMVLEISKP